MKIYPDVLSIKSMLSEHFRIQLEDYFQEPNGIPYSACGFSLNGKKIRFRSANLTPKKLGQFVTLWKRNETGSTAPLDSADPFDGIMVSARKADAFGLFIFPKSILSEHTVISTREQGGKRGFRVYPPWDSLVSRQAIKTQSWQSDYFVELQPKLDIKNLREIVKQI